MASMACFYQQNINLSSYESYSELVSWIKAQGMPAVIRKHNLCQPAD